MPGFGPPLHPREQPQQEPAVPPSRRRRWLRLAAYLIFAAAVLSVTIWGALRASSHMTFTSP